MTRLPYRPVSWVAAAFALMACSADPDESTGNVASAQKELSAAEGPACAVTLDEAALVDLAWEGDPVVKLRVRSLQTRTVLVDAVIIANDGAEQEKLQLGQRELPPGASVFYDLTSEALRRGAERRSIARIHVDVLAPNESGEVRRVGRARSPWLQVETGGVLRPSETGSALVIAPSGPAQRATRARLAADLAGLGDRYESVVIGPGVNLEDISLARSASNVVAPEAP